MSCAAAAIPEFLFWVFILSHLHNDAMRDHIIFRRISLHFDTPQPTRIFWLNLLCVFFECGIPSLSPILFVSKVHMWQVSLLKCCCCVKHTNYLSRRLWKDCVGRISDSLLITLPCCLLIPSLIQDVLFYSCSFAQVTITGWHFLHWEPSLPSLMHDAHEVIPAQGAAVKLWTADAFNTVWDFLWLKCINSLYNILEL